MRSLASLQDKMTRPSVTTVRNKMLHTFSKSLRVGLMAGVGGGIPSNAHDMGFGDVVISCSEGTVGGREVVQYDMGKVGSGGSFIEMGNLHPQSYPPTKTKPDPAKKSLASDHPNSPH